MKVSIRLHGHVGALLDKDIDGIEVELDEPQTVSEVLKEQLGVNPMLFAAIVIDGKSRDRDYLIENDTEIMLVSPTAGG